MALSNAVSYDVVVGIKDRGPVAGSPVAGAVTVITTLCRRIQNAQRIGKRIDVSGFGTSNRYRPGKEMAEVTLETLISYSGRITLTIGHYIEVAETIGANTPESFTGFLESMEDDINDDSEAIQRLVIVCPADGGPELTGFGSESAEESKAKSGAKSR